MNRMPAERWLSVSDVQVLILRLEQRIVALHQDLRNTNTITQIILAQIGEGTHLTKEQAVAAITAIRGKKVSMRTVERMISRGELTMEQIPGTQKFGIPITEIHAGWMSVAKLREERAKGKG